MAYGVDDGNVPMEGDDTLFMPDQVVKQKALAAKVRRNPALSMPTSGVSNDSMDYSQTMGASPTQDAPAPGAAASAAPQTSAQTQQAMYDRMFQRPDAEPLIEHHRQKSEEGNRKLMLGLTLAALGGETLSPMGKQFSEHGMKEAGDYEIPGGWGVVGQKGVVWNEAKQREADLARMQHMYTAQVAAEAKRDSSEQANALRMTLAAMKPPTQEPLVPVFDPDTGTVTYMPRSQAAGKQAPPKGAGAGGRPLPAHAVENISKNEQKVAQFSSLASSWKPDYGGLGTNVGNIHGRFNPLASDASRDQAQWWQNYQEVVNDIRHGQFGSALTPTEKAEFEKAIITPNTDPAMVAKYLERQVQLAEIARQRHLSNFGKAGFNVSGFDAGAPRGPGGAGASFDAPAAPTAGAPPPGAVREKKTQ